MSCTPVRLPWWRRLAAGMEVFVWLGRVFCRHRDVVMVRGIFGDEINLTGGKRGWYKCRRCGRELAL